MDPWCAGVGGGEPIFVGEPIVQPSGLHGRLNYCVGGEVQTLHHLDRRMYLLGYSTYTRAPV